MKHPRPLEQLVEDEASAVAARLLYERVERLDPLLRLFGIDIGQLVLELVVDVVDVTHLGRC
jgi:hypothetical protein